VRLSPIPVDYEWPLSRTLTNIEKSNHILDSGIPLPVSSTENLMESFISVG